MKVALDEVVDNITLQIWRQNMPKKIPMWRQSSAVIYGKHQSDDQ